MLGQSGDMTDSLNDALMAARDLAGQNGDVPSRRDNKEMPERVSAAHHAISGVSRLTTLRYLLDNPASARQQIVDDTGISPGAARASLEELESLGYVCADVEGPRNGKIVRYTANRSILTDDLAAFMAWVLR